MFSKTIHVLTIFTIIAATFAFAPSAMAGDASCTVRTTDNFKKLLLCVTLEGVRSHQAAFQEIADANGGIRASGTAGYDASVDYGTLPPIGDTHDDPSGSMGVAMTGNGAAIMIPEDPIAMAPAAGVAVLWRNLERWPDVTELSQAVMTWGNFPTKTHKHADDLGLSLWAGGVQWVRSVGYLPYDDEGIRESAIGWRSSNAPHWVGEDPAIERSASLLSSVRAGQEAYLDVSRPGAAGSGIRRQFLQFGEGAWLSIESFESPAPREAEILWRFAPGINLLATRVGWISAGEKPRRRSQWRWTGRTGPSARPDAVSPSTTGSAACGCGWTRGAPGPPGRVEVMP